MLRETREEICNRKTGLTKSKAIKTVSKARDINKYGATDLGYYKCDICEKWHMYHIK